MGLWLIFLFSFLNLEANKLMDEIRELQKSLKILFSIRLHECMKYKNKWSRFRVHLEISFQVLSKMNVPKNAFLRHLRNKLQSGFGIRAMMK